MPMPMRMSMPMPTPWSAREASSRCLIGYTTDREDGSDRRGDHEAHIIPTYNAPVIPMEGCTGHAL